MASGLVELARALREVVAGFDAAAVSGDEAVVIVEELASTEKACAAARARAALRAGECGSHEGRGFADAADWVARACGSSLGEARAAMATVEAVGSCPVTRAALVTGELSLVQAQAITQAEAVRPGSEAELVELAVRSGLVVLREECRKRRLASIEPDDLHRRQHQAREFRHWRDDMGMVRLSGALPPEVGVPLVNRLDAETDRLRRAARKEGGTETRAAHAADALVAMASGHGKGKAISAELVVVCDLRAYRRGHVQAGEVCHVIGGGPVPVRVARAMVADAFVKAVVHDGVRIESVAHFGRHIPAELRTALELGLVPGFDGVRCVEAGCGRRHGLEWDHVDPVANGGATSYDNLQSRCWPHHRAKTERDRSAGRLGPGPGPPGDGRAPP